MQQWVKAAFLRKYIHHRISGIGENEGGLPLDKKIPEMGIEEMRVSLRSTGPLGFPLGLARGFGKTGRLAGVPVPTRAFP